MMEKGSDIFGLSYIEKTIGQSLPQIICKLFQSTKISALINKLINEYVVIVIILQIYRYSKCGFM